MFMYIFCSRSSRFGNSPAIAIGKEYKCVEIVLATDTGLTEAFSPGSSQLEESLQRALRQNSQAKNTTTCSVDTVTSPLVCSNSDRSGRSMAYLAAHARTQPAHQCCGHENRVRRGSRSA